MACNAYQVCSDIPQIYIFKIRWPWYQRTLLTIIGGMTRQLIENSEKKKDTDYNIPESERRRRVLLHERIEDNLVVSSDQASTH